MQPLGRKKVTFPNKTKEWFERGIKMWWEVIVQPSKKTERQQSKLQIQKHIDA